MPTLTDISLLDYDQSTEQAKGEYGMVLQCSAVVCVCVCVSQHRENRAVGSLRPEGAAVCPQVRPPRCVPAL